MTSTTSNQTSAGLSTSRLLLCWFAAWLFSFSAMAQTPGTGVVQGRVINPLTKDYVANAEVRLAGTNQVVYTEHDGSFAITGVPVGPASLTVTCSGYVTATDSFTVSAGQTAVRDISLASSAPTTTTKDGVVQLAAFTVASEREGNSKAIMAQRRNMNISTSVSSDVFGEVADGNVGEFLKYLPGVDLDYVESEARGPRLGGMDGQYVGVSFDGMRTASADANRGNGSASRATSFEGFSIPAIESIEINWTASPENDADSPAGTINMKSKRAFDRKGRRVSYSAGLNFNSEEFTLHATPGPADYNEEKYRKNWSLDYSESFFDQKFGLLLSASQTNSYTEQITVTNGYNATPISTDPRPMVIRQIDMKDGPKFIHKDSLLLTADWKATPRLVLSVNMLYSYFDGEFWNRNFTFVAANDNANATVSNGRASVGGDGVTTIVATRAASGNTPTSKTNAVATLSNGGGSSAKLTYSRQLSPKFEYKIGSVVVDGAGAYSRSVNNYESIERGFSNSEGGSAASSWTATRTSPVAAEWTIRQTSGPDWFNLASFTSTDTRSGGTRITNDDRTWTTEKWTGVGNVRWILPFFKDFPTVVKFGGKWDEETRITNTMSDVNIWAYTGPGGNTTTVSPTTGANVNTAFGNWANLGPQYVSSNPFEMGRSNVLTVYNINGQQGIPPRVSRNAIAELFRAHPDQWTFMGNPENYYADFIANPRHFQQTISAGYGQAQVRVTNKLQLLFGVRMEETRNVFNELGQPLSRADVTRAGYAVNAPGTNAGRPLTIAGINYQYLTNPRVLRKSNYQDWFPSVLFKYYVGPNFEWQGGFNRSIGRPAIDDLTGLWTIDENNKRVSVPNAELQPEYHRKFQTRLAYYFRGNSPGQLTFSLSQVNSRNFVKDFDLTEGQFGLDDPDFVGYTFRERSNSDTEQRLRSLDFGYNQTLGFIPIKYLQGLNFSVNYSRAYANQRRGGLAPHRVSSRLGYNYGRFSTTYAIIWAAERPESSTPGRYFREITKVDLSFGWRLSNRMSLYAQGRNVANMPDRWYQSPNGVTEGKQGHLRQLEEYGANWVFGVKGTF